MQKLVFHIRVLVLRRECLALLALRFRVSDHVFVLLPQQRAPCITMTTSSNLCAAARVLVFMGIIALVAFTAIAEAKKDDPSSPGQPGTPSPGHHKPAIVEGEKSEIGTPSPSYSKTPADPGCGVGLGVNILNKLTSVTSGNKWLVEITNVCRPNCRLSNLVLNCPEFGFGSNQFIDPALFKSNGDGTCTVKNGNMMEYQETVQFEYFQIYKESLSVRSAVWHCT